MVRPFTLVNISTAILFKHGQAKVYLRNKETQQSLQFIVNIKCNASRLCRWCYFIKAQELEVLSLSHLYSIKTKIAQCHYVMTL